LSLKQDDAKSLPEGWSIKKLGDVCEIINGGTPDTKVKEYWNGQNLWLTPKDMGKLKSIYVSDTERKITNSGLKNSSAKIIPINSVILSSRAPIGHLSINTKPISTNQGCKGIIPKDNVETIFLFYFLRNSVNYLNELGSGTTFKELSGTKLSQIQIPIPPLPEQKRIIAILDEAFAAIAKAKENAEKNLQNAKDLFESYLQSVFVNKGENWEEKKFGEVCNLMTGGTPSKSKPEYFKNGKIKWLVSGDIHQKEIFDCDGRITEEGLKNSNAKYLPIDSTIIALNGQGKTRGSVALLRVQATCNQSLVSIYPKDKKEILSEYIYFNLHSRYQELRKLTGDAGNERRGLNMSIIGNIYLPIPLLEQQRIIVNQASLINPEIIKLQIIYKQKINSMEDLKKSILQKAFTGELNTIKEIEAA
jgi:type I restriction enzyme S subunit